MFSMQNLNHSIHNQVRNHFSFARISSKKKLHILLFTFNSTTASRTISFVKLNATSKQSMYQAREIKSQIKQKRNIVIACDIAK